MANVSTDVNSRSLDDLLDSAVRIARSENRRTEEILSDALAQYERGKRLTRLGAYGKEQARRTGLKAVDIDREIHEARKRPTRSR